MAKKQKPAPPPSPEELGLESFDAPPEDMGLSLDELSQTYAALLGGGEDPYQTAPAVGEPIPGEDSYLDEEPDDEPEPADNATDKRPRIHERLPAEHEDNFEITPRSILEAMLFVGHPNNEPLTSQYVASLMRGVRADEIVELIGELNEIYDAEQTPYHIESSGAGYQLALRPEVDSLRDKFFGRVREVRLSQTAVDVLAIVAYNQPVTREEIDQLRNKPSGSALAQLVRRELLRIARPTDSPRTIQYFTTDRFLEQFGIDSLDDLPRTQDLDRSL